MLVGKSKPDTPHRIPLDANIKYVCGFSASIRIRVDVARATFHVDSMTLQLTTKNGYQLYSLTLEEQYHRINPSTKEF